MTYMPEQSGTDTATESAAVAGQPGAGQQDGGTASATQDQKLTAEAAKWRVQYREEQKRAAELRTEIEQLKSNAAASPGTGEDASELAKLRREMGDLHKTVKDAQDRASRAEAARSQETVNNAILKGTADLKLIDADEASIVIAHRGKTRMSEDGKAVMSVIEDGEEREVEITAENIKKFKLLSERFYPSEGVAGSGSKGGARGQAASGIDYEKGLNDQSYFNANAAAMAAEHKRRNSAN